MVEKANKQVILELFNDEIDLIVKASGYPKRTVSDPAKAFAYGLIIGTLLALRKDWEENR